MDNNDITNHGGWSEYGRLVLKELERLNEGQERLREDLDRKFSELNSKMGEFKSTETSAKELQEWKAKVTEVWSPTQMTQAKNELYRQKNQWQRVMGIVIAVEVIVGIIFTLINI